MRIYRRYDERDYPGLWRDYACHKRTRKRTLLDEGCNDSISCGLSASFWLAGSVVAVHHRRSSPIDPTDWGGSLLELIDTATGKVRYRLDGGPVSDLVLKRNGAFALVCYPKDPPSNPADIPYLVEVKKREGGGQLTLLDSGKIDPASLAFSKSSSTVYWLNDGQPHAAKLK